jgi:DNA-binding PadR family transcriptional regulator
MAIRDNVLRGKILSFLRDLFPQGTDRITVVGIYYEFYKPDDIVDSLEYLVSKGYVDKREFPHPARKLEKLASYTINAKGIDLCDGLNADPGITIIAEGA